MNETVKDILGILDGGRPDLQVAAAQILGELQLKDPAIVRSLAAGAARSHVLGRYVLEALWRIGTPEALRVVVRILIEHDGLIDQASHVLGEVGAAAHGAIGDAFADAPPDRRLRLLQVLAKSPTKDVVRPFVHALATPEISEAAARVVLASVESMPAAMRKALHAALSQVLEQPLPESCVAAVLGVVAKVDPGGAKVLLLHHASEKSTPSVRLAALRALTGQQLTALQTKAFLLLLDDQAHHAVHAAVRDLLTAMPEWPEGLVPQLKRFLVSRNVEQRLFALRAMRSSPSAELVRQALKLRSHDDPRFRDAAEEVLASSRQAIEPVLRLLQLTKDPGEAQRLAAILARLGASMPPRQLRALAERAIKLLPTKSFVADHMLDVVIGAAGQKLVPFFLDRALRWRRSRRFGEALHVLAKLASAKLLDGEGRYQLAVTRFLQDAGRPGAEGATPGNAAMGFFTSLLRDGFPLLDRLKKDTSMPPEQQLRLATYFADTVGAERRFGAELLQVLAQRHKGRTGEEARHALRAVGY
jgi:hypothetical protein